jgi:hypothetical protein
MLGMRREKAMKDISELSKMMHMKRKMELERINLIKMLAQHERTMEEAEERNRVETEMHREVPEREETAGRTFSRKQLMFFAFFVVLI